MSETEPSRFSRAENPDVEFLAPHIINANTLNNLGITHCDITEWVPLGSKQKIARTDSLSPR